MPQAKIDVATIANHTIVPAVARHRIRVIAYKYLAAGTVNATFKSNDTALEGPIPLVVNSGAVCSECMEGHLLTAEGEALKLTLDAAIQVSGHLTYLLEEVP